MENTLENKAKFFAQYWGVNCISNDDYVWRANENFDTVLSIYNGDLSKWYANLKSLENISHEDLEYIRPLVGYIDTEDGISLVKRWLTNLWKDYEDVNYFALTDKKGVINTLKITDYLRLKGYALPWMGLPVETQIDYDWIKLKAKEVKNV